MFAGLTNCLFTKSKGAEVHGRSFGTTTPLSAIGLATGYLASTFLF